MSPPSSAALNLWPLSTVMSFQMHFFLFLDGTWNLPYFTGIGLGYSHSDADGCGAFLFRKRQPSVQPSSAFRCLIWDCWIAVMEELPLISTHLHTLTVFHVFHLSTSQSYSCQQWNIVLCTGHAPSNLVFGF